MTIGEVGRLVESKQRIYKRELKQKATFDYRLAELIGRSIARIYSSSQEMPNIADVYPSLFEKEEIEEKMEEKRIEVFSQKLKQFAKIHNSQYREVAKDE